ncbi:unnamed protein product [Chondrus crispus]|uniref:Uncharacterized protein n=1 Tax=Chondrus crispus TaxID=2769 RepID=R7Q3Q4_CHOCR|nr:unnamed protein product [Chondrus crispus]CDF33167.1 unnamed protein product [Chondrus crispus]|eukprot:XP_005712970.1 unnamed protein product [Chondrus crispus]
MSPDCKWPTNQITVLRNVTPMTRLHLYRTYILCYVSCCAVFCMKPGSSPRLPYHTCRFVASRDRLLSLYGMVLPKHSDAKLSSRSTRVRCLGNCCLLNQYDTRFLDMLPECQGHVGCNTKGILARPRCVCFHTHVQYYTFLASLMDASS